MCQFPIRFLYFCLFWATSASGLTQDLSTGENVIDTALIFTGDTAERVKAKLEREMADVALDTGAQLIFRTESTSTGSSARKIAANFADETLDASRPGAVMVHIRSSDAIGIAVSAGSGEVPDYVFATVEKAAGSRPSNLEPYEYAARSAREMTAVFSKYYSPEAAKGDPRKRGDKILMATMAGAVLILAFTFVALSRRNA